MQIIRKNFFILSLAHEKNPSQLEREFQMWSQVVALTSLAVVYAVKEKNLTL